MATLTSNFSKVLYDDLKGYVADLYAGKVLYPCSEDCAEGCDGEHYYEFVESFEPIVEIDFGHKPNRIKLRVEIES